MCCQWQPDSLSSTPPYIVECTPSKSWVTLQKWPRRLPPSKNRLRGCVSENDFKEQNRVIFRFTLFRTLVLVGNYRSHINSWRGPNSIFSTQDHCLQTFVSPTSQNRIKHLPTYSVQSIRNWNNLIYSWPRPNSGFSTQGHFKQQFGFQNRLRGCVS